MADGIGTIITIARTIKTMCAKADACRSLLVIVERKMDSIIPILEDVENNVEIVDSVAVVQALSSLKREMKDTKRIVEKAQKLGRVSFILKSGDLREKVEVNLRSIHLSMTGLQLGHSNSIIVELKDFHANWKAREKELQEEKEQMEMIRQRLSEAMANPAEANKENIAKVAGIDVSHVGELENELLKAKAERDQLGADLTCAIATQDTVKRDKANAEAKFMDQILGILSESKTLPTPVVSNRPVPESCYCPILGTIMQDPVTVDSEGGCNHTMERSAAKHWLDLGNIKCPICNSPLKSRRLSPNVILRNLIFELQVPSEAEVSCVSDFKPTVPEPSQTQNQHPPSRDDNKSSVREIADAMASAAETIANKHRKEEIRHYRIEVNGDFALYAGRVNDDEKPHGQGRMRMPDGSVYEGAFKDGVRHGLGHLTLKNKNIYHGDFKNGEMHGVGKLTYRNGDVYEGQFKGGVMEGIGTLRSKSYDRYGALSGNLVYSGEFNAGHKHGQGTLKHLDGSVLTGTFHHNEVVGPVKFHSQYGVEWLGDREAGPSGLGVQRIVWFSNGDCEVGLYDVGIGYDLSEYEMTQGLHFGKDWDVAYYYTNSMNCCGGQPANKKFVSVDKALSLVTKMGYKCKHNAQNLDYKGLVEGCKLHFE